MGGRLSFVLRLLDVLLLYQTTRFMALRLCVCVCVRSSSDDDMMACA